MERQRRQQQEAAAAAVLHAALVLLNRGGACKEPLTPGMFARPNLKGLQSALYLLYRCIRGPARTKKELQQVYPVLEPGQAREFRAAMQGWVQELAAARALAPDSAKYFVAAYGGSNSHRTVLLLLDLCALALARELGGGPLDGLPGGESMQLGEMAAAQRTVHGRLDSIVAAMQRLRQLHGQAAAAGGLAARAPPPFAGCPAAARRGELLLELLRHGPPLTAQPEAVCPDSWADLVAAGRGGGGAHPSSSALVSSSASPLTARRLSNPAQEASRFVAEGMAADAAAATVHRVLAARLEAVGAALQAAAEGGAGAGDAQVRALLAEAAACRESLMLSVQHELAAAAIRDQQQAAPARLQLLPPCPPPCDPFWAGTQAAQAAAAAQAAGGAQWSELPPGEVEALRRSMWQRAEQASPPGTREQEAAAAAGSEAGVSPGGEEQLHGSGREPADSREQGQSAGGSPAGSLGAKFSGGRRERLPPQLEQAFAKAFPTRVAGGQQPGSPCMAESCASASVAGDGRASRSHGGAAASGQQPPRGRLPPLAASPMLSVAASFVPARGGVLEQGSSGGQQPAVPASSDVLWDRPPQPARAPLMGLFIDTPGDALAASPGSCASPAPSWRHAGAAAAASPSASSPAGSASSGRRRSASISFTLTPPRRLDDSPVAAGGDILEGTPASKAGRDEGHPASYHAARPQQQADRMRGWQDELGSPGDALLASCLRSKPGTARLAASSLAGALPSPAGKPAVWRTGSRPEPPQEAQQWLLAAAYGSPAALATPPPPGSPASPRPRGSNSLGRLRSAALHTTASPAGRPLHRLASGGMETPVPPGWAPSYDAGSQLSPHRSLHTPRSAMLGGSDAGARQGVGAGAGLVTPPLSLKESPGRSSGAAVPTSSEADSTAGSLAALMQRMAMLPPAR